MSEEIIKILEYLGGKFGIAIDWTSNNVIPYVEELCGKFIKWEISTSVAWMVIWVVLCLGVLTFNIVANKNDCDFDGFEWVVFIFVLLITLVVCVVQIFDIIECNTFPEKVLYDYIATKINQR